MEDKQTVPLEQEIPRTMHESTVMKNEKTSVFLRIIDRINQGSAVLAGTTLLIMILLVVFNSIKRLFSDPIAGTVELVSWLGAVTTIFSLGYAQLHKGHVFIDLLYKKFPETIQHILHTFMNLASIAFFSVAGWQIALYGINLMENGVVSPTMRISFYPIVIFCSLGFLGLLLALVKETILIWRGGS
ncbi:TRAP transporter small permease [Pseudalkalibacillus sp. A8]|uniref:TRAP transporter small permease n=1 Tax=Pseudalkalibacillus sp. A8 TaxID=3382641 RepID=UPI0038B491FC